MGNSFFEALYVRLKILHATRMFNLEYALRKSTKQNLNSNIHFITKLYISVFKDC